MEIEVSHSQMEILKNFNVRKTSLREIDEILSNIIKKPQYSYMDGVMYVFDILQIPIGRVLKTVQEHVRIAVSFQCSYLCLHVYFLYRKEFVDFNVLA